MTIFLGVPLSLDRCYLLKVLFIFFFLLATPEAIPPNLPIWDICSLFLDRAIPFSEFLFPKFAARFNISSCVIKIPLRLRLNNRFSFLILKFSYNLKLLYAKMVNNGTSCNWEGNFIFLLSGPKIIRFDNNRLFASYIMLHLLYFYLTWIINGGTTSKSPK